MIEKHRRLGTWKNNVDQYICLTQFAKNKMVEGGLPADKISIKPNFIVNETSFTDQNFSQRNGALFVGRLSDEKGIRFLLDNWKNMDVPLTIVGDGPLSLEVEHAARTNNRVHYLGRLSMSEIYRQMSMSQVLLVPSLWYEGFPMVIVEAFSNGLPVIASNLGSLAEVIQDQVTGDHFIPNDAEDFCAVLKRYFQLPACRRQEMSRDAELEYKRFFTPANNYEILSKIYKKIKNDFEK